VHHLREERLVLFVGGLATLEVLSTIVLVEDLRSDPGLAAYGVISLLVAVFGIRLLARNRHALLGLE